MSKFLFDVEHRNRLEQKGILKRFSVNCYGTQATLESIRAEKMEKFKELKDKRGTREYDMWFLKYTFDKDKPKPKPKQKKTIKKRPKQIKSSEFF
jgi:hypothetical protein